MFETGDQDNTMTQATMEKQTSVIFGWAFDSNLGWIAVATDTEEITGLKFGYDDATSALSSLVLDVNNILDRPSKQLLDWQKLIVRMASGKQIDIADVPVRMKSATTFAGIVQRMCREIPWGQVMSYGELAAQAGSPRAARAVGTVMRTNCIPLLIPCHRVVAATGLGGYSAAGGISAKQKLIEMERAKSS
jgi:methylated-DNA-[protein]-cysteine S-methyltransferase